MCSRRQVDANGEVVISNDLGGVRDQTTFVLDGSAGVQTFETVFSCVCMDVVVVVGGGGDGGGVPVCAYPEEATATTTATAEQQSKYIRLTSIK